MSSRNPQVPERRTIVSAIRDVLRESGRPLSVGEIYGAIERRGLFSFSSPNATHIVRTQLRRHAVGASGSSAKSKYFRELDGARFELID